MAERPTPRLKNGRSGRAGIGVDAHGGAVVDPTGQGEGGKAMWGYIVGAVGFLGMLVTIAIAVAKMKP